MAKATTLSSVSPPYLEQALYRQPPWPSTNSNPDLFPVSEYPADHTHHQIPEDRPTHSLVFRTASYDHTTNIGSTMSTKFCIVNTQDGLTEMTQAIIPQDQTRLYVAVEASLLVLHVHPEPGCTYIVDLESMGATAFEPCEARACEGGLEQKEHQGAPMPSLRAILESSSFPKVLFNCGPACAFLAGRFGITMGCVEDVQCLESEGRLASQGERVDLARDLRKCLE